MTLSVWDPSPATPRTQTTGSSGLRRMKSLYLLQSTNRTLNTETQRHRGTEPHRENTELRKHEGHEGKRDTHFSVDCVSRSLWAAVDFAPWRTGKNKRPRIQDIRSVASCIRGRSFLPALAACGQRSRRLLCLLCGESFGKLLHRP